MEETKAIQKSFDLLRASTLLYEAPIDALIAPDHTVLYAFRRFESDLYAVLQYIDRELLERNESEPQSEVLVYLSVQILKVLF